MLKTEGCLKTREYSMHMSSSIISHCFTVRIVIICHRTKEALERVAYEYCEDLKRQNVVYAEIRYNPFCEVEAGPTGEEYCEGVIAGLEKGEKEFGVKVRSILCFMRENPSEWERQYICLATAMEICWCVVLYILHIPPHTHTHTHAHTHTQNV